MLHKYGSYLFVLFVLHLLSCQKKEKTESSEITTQHDSESSFKKDTLLYFKSFDTANGLLSSDLRNVFTDKLGYVWISSGKGLMRYDGHTFTPYFDNIEKNIRLQGTCSFFEDQHGKLWVFSGTGYLHWFDREHNEFRAFKTDFENGWSDDKPMQMLQESDGKFWLGGYGGLQLIDPQNNTVQSFPVQKIRNMDWPHPEKIRVEVIKKDSLGNIWLGTRKFGLVKFDLSKKKYDFVGDRPHFSGYLLDDWITDIELADDGTFWLTDFQAGLIHFDPYKEEIMDFIEVEKLLPSPHKVAIRDLQKEGKFFWLATNYHGLILIDPLSRVVLKQYAMVNSEIPTNKNLAIHKDIQGNIWLAGNKLTVASGAFYTAHTQSLGDNLAAYALTPTDSGVLCSTRLGIFKVTPHGDPVKLTVGDAAFYGIIKTKNGDIWTGGSFDVFHFDEHLASVKASFEYGTVLDSIGNTLRRALKMTQSSDGNIWIIDDWGRIKFIDPENGEMKNIFALAQDTLSERFIEVKSVLDDPEHQRMIIGTDLGLVTVNSTDFKVKWIRNTPQHKENVSYLYRDTHGQIWAIIANKLFQLDVKNLSLEPFKFKDIAVDENYNWIIEQPANTYWIQSSAGYLKYADGKATLYKNDNFSEGGKHHPAPVVSSGGLIYFGGEAGVTIINPDLLQRSQTPPLVNLRYLKTAFQNEEKTLIDSVIHIGERQKISLGYTQNRFSLKFDALHFKDPSLNKFRYQLVGYDQSYILAGSSGEVYYTNLNPGNYTLKYAASNSDGIWSADKEFKVTISPPWYLAWWAKLLYLLLAVAAVYSWIRYRVFLKLQKFKATEEIRTSISADLHDDVGSLLAGLSMKAELMAMGIKKVETENLEKISEMAREAMERMRDTVWAIDSRKDKYENLLDRMRSFAEQNLPEKGFGYDFVTEGLEKQSFINPLIRQNLYLILKESITNIIKHSDGNKVEVSLRKQNQQLTLSVKDNGHFKKQIPTDGLGLSNLKARAQKIGGHLDVLTLDGFEVKVVLG